MYRPIGAIGVEEIGNYLQPFAVCLFSVAKARCLYRSGKNTCIGFKVGARVRPGGVVVRALDLRLRRSRVQLPAVALSGSNLGQVVHTHVPLSPFTKQYNLVPVKRQWCPNYGWESNRRSDVALAMRLRHRLQSFIVYTRAHAS